MRAFELIGLTFEDYKQARENCLAKYRDQGGHLIDCAPCGKVTIRVDDPHAKGESKRIECGQITDYINP